MWLAGMHPLNFNTINRKQMKKAASSPDSFFLLQKLIQTYQ